MFSLFRRNQPHPTIGRLYGAIVAQARLPAFYTDFGVPDTIEGRFELLLLHTFLVCHRLKGEVGTAKSASQELFDAFLDDMDRTLREMGTGDLTVPKRMKKIGQAFYGRTAAYDSALETKNEDLPTALARNVLECSPTDPAALRLAAYARAAADRLAATEVSVLLRGEVAFPNPATCETPDNA
ncbi:ubiquinol-cytochrome C chaperone family protein [Aquabacter cavernae]|uniref:ubiquinol-cytochrome C chaperone family protein n=1 Tax=Aquabacter cavernae TaxID=2496029 RepID=UPI000F8DA4CC|nr:ubiquinol-cytochrome C chaperone family protein [Aquabacter cavernae]